MVRTEICIHVYSEMNNWIDFCIVLVDEKILIMQKKLLGSIMMHGFLPKTRQTNQLWNILVEN